MLTHDNEELRVWLLGYQSWPHSLHHTYIIISHGSQYADSSSMEKVGWKWNNAFFFCFFFLEKGALELQLDELKTSLDSMKRKTIYHISIELFISWLVLHLLHMSPTLTSLRVYFPKTSNLWWDESFIGLFDALWITHDSHAREWCPHVQSFFVKSVETNTCLVP